MDGPCMPIEAYVVAMGAKRGQGQKKPLQGSIVARDTIIPIVVLTN